MIESIGEYKIYIIEGGMFLIFLIGTITMMQIFIKKIQAIQEKGGKDKIIDEKNTLLYQLQERLNSMEKNIGTSGRERDYDRDKELLLEEKRRMIETLQQRLQEVEHKLKRVLLLHKTIAEKEQIKESIIEEKNTIIINLQYKLCELEKKLETLAMRNFDTIDKKIERENDKTQIFIILGILFVIILYLYTR